jgi:DNA polymerase elongation subunit (family B)
LDYPDIVTGWNVKFFDIPYLVNRITNLLGEEYAKRLSPWNVLNQRTATVMGKERLHYILLGTSTLDYLEIYKKFAPKGQSQESYKLDFICHEELGERKLSYEEYGSLHGLYKQDHQKFIEYNIRDVELVEKLDDKLKLIDLALTLAYDSKSNYDDVISQVRMWDNIIFNHLKKKDKVVSPIERYNKNSAYVGAYVKDPIIGLHKWIASFDLNSLYPHLIMQFNISPDKIVGEVMDGISIDSLLNKEVDTSQLKERGLTVTPNGQLFKVDSQGFLAEIMQTMYNDRSKYKKQAIQAKKDLEIVIAEIDRRKKT